MATPVLSRADYLRPKRHENMKVFRISEGGEGNRNITITSLNYLQLF